MNVFRVSLRALIYLVLVAALDIVWVIHLSKFESILFGGAAYYSDLPLFGMANVLAVAGYLLLVRRRRRPFLAGFFSGGLLCATAYIYFLRADPPLLGEIHLGYGREVEVWFQDNPFRLRNPNYFWSYGLPFTLVGLFGTILLSGLASLFGLLNRLVATGKIPRVIAVALMVVVLVSVTIRMRRIHYQRFEDHYAEVYAVLSSEARDRSKEIEKLKAGDMNPIARTPEEIKDLEAELDRYTLPTAETLRRLERYRRAMSHLWPVVED